MQKKILLLLTLSSWLGCLAQEGQSVYQTENLTIKRVAGHTFQHVSYLETARFGKVACNGMIVITDGEALVFDTPVGDQAALELIDWVQKDQNAEVIGVVATHFHIDCLGSLSVFHRSDIPSWSNATTINLARGEGSVAPKQGFADSLRLKVGDTSILTLYPGAGHTPDNIIGYFREDKVLFGGCLIKSMGAGKGNLEDADPGAWPKTVGKLKQLFPDAQHIIPGHGDAGGAELLDYTITLFRTEKR